jgi:uncharacterized protein (TIGR03067 family)
MRCFLPLLAVLLVGFAPAPFPRTDSTKADLKKLQGEWVRVSHTIGGTPLSPAGATLVIAGDRLEYGEHPGKEGWEVELNARTTPKRLDRTWRRSQLLPSAGWIGVYSLQGDTLTICSVRNADDEDRPKDLEGKLPGHVVEVFKRQKR